MCIFYWFSTSSSYKRKVHRSRFLVCYSMGQGGTCQPNGFRPSLVLASGRRFAVGQKDLTKISGRAKCADAVGAVGVAL
jgi:hypothetical protein